MWWLVCGNGIVVCVFVGLQLGLGHFLGANKSVLTVWRRDRVSNALIVQEIMQWFIWQKNTMAMMVCCCHKLAMAWYDMVNQFCLFSPSNTLFPKLMQSSFLSKYNLNVLAINYFNNIIMHTILFIFDLQIFVFVLLNAQKKNYLKTRSIIKTQ